MEAVGQKSPELDRVFREFVGFDVKAEQNGKKREI